MRVLKTIILALLVSIGMGSFAGGTWAQTITVNNPSFEIPVVGGADSGQYQYLCPTSIPDWTCSTSDGGLFAPNTASPIQYQPGSDGLTSPLIVPDGNQVLFLNSPMTVSQNTAATIAVGTTYTLNVWVGERADYPFPTTTIELLANGVAITGAVTTISSSGGSNGSGQWVDETVTYTATNTYAGQTLGIGLTDAEATASQDNFDEVTLSASPETNTLLLFGTGLLAIGGVVRRKRTSKSRNTVALG